MNFEGKTFYVLGANGYIGWPLSVRLEELGAQVVRLDNYNKMNWARELEIEPLATHYLRRATYQIDLANDPLHRLYRLFTDLPPDAVVHLAEQPSAPLSMYTRKWADRTQWNNVCGTLNLAFAVAHAGSTAHIVKLGSMGEYGTPRIPIREGWLDVELDGYRDRVLYPKKPGSFYHASKVHDSVNLEFCCRNWGLAVTDLNQGVVWGTETEDCPFDDPVKRTTFWYDEMFGTVLNRFACQTAIDTNLTIYGEGTQKRGFIHLQDSIQCICLALANPARPGEFRVANQLSEIKSILELAALSNQPYDLIRNPRTEDMNHLYKVEHEVLPGLGFEPHMLLNPYAFGHMVQQIEAVPDLHRHVDAIKAPPKILWRQKG